MKHYIIFQTKEGTFLVFVCVSKYTDIESELREKINFDKITFENKEDVARFMDKYIEDVQKADYHPYWLFEDAVTIC